MKSRLAISMVLALGVLMGGTGAAGALSGSSDQGSAGKAQYPDSVVPQGNSAPGNDVGGDNDVAGTVGSSGPGGGDVQEARQVTAADTGSSLPFTGFAAIPVLLGGMALIVMGFALRHSARREPQL